MKKTVFVITCLSLVSLSLMAQNINSFPVSTKIENGIIEGLYDTESGLQLYFGIPFARPPVGDLRWKAPQPPENWEGVLDTKSFSPRPVQTIVYGDMKSRSAGLSEDCLYLNVWTPADHSTKGLPVLVYFYGGGFLAGDASELRYDGASMAKRGMVVVTVNYRLNIFGFFSHPELSEEAPYQASGNYGLLDQNASLKWVKDNIEAFGGNPGKVTIAGESAGSISVSAQMSSPLSKDLISGAIGESGAGIFPTLYPVSLSEAEQTGLEFAQNAGYPSLVQLRALNTREVYEIYKESGNFRFPTVVDGYFYPKTIPELFNAGEQSQVPLLLGWNSAEIPGMALMQGLPYEEKNYINRVKEVYPDDYEDVLKAYPYGSDKEIERSATALASDGFIAYSTWKWFDLHRKNSNQPVFRYLYSKMRPPLADQKLEPGLAGGTVEKSESSFWMAEPIGAPHACEIEYCMGNLHLIEEYVWTSDDYKVSETMQSYFANFILTGNPNGGNLPDWPSAESSDPNPPVMIIDTESKAIKAENDGRYLLLDKIFRN